MIDERKNSYNSTIAVFDFDGTLTYMDSFFWYLISVVGVPKFIIYMLSLSPTLFLYKLGKLRNDVAKERVLKKFLSGSDANELMGKAESFSKNKIPLLLKGIAIKRLRWHQQQGHKCILVSASLELYLTHWGKLEGFSDVIGTKLEINSIGELTGSINGKNCYGKEKVKRLEQLLDDRSKYYLYAYGDSKGDLELLNYANKGFYRKFPKS